jgi:hypothetical protein
MTRAFTYLIVAIGALALWQAGGAAQTSRDGSAEIVGTVVTTGTSPAPIARVLVTISGTGLTPSRTQITDEQGRFAFRQLSAGSFTIVARRAPFVTTAYGAKRPGRPGTPVVLGAGQHVDGLTIALPRGAAISGMVRQASGEPAAGIDVNIRAVGTQPDPLTPRVITDDRGVFRGWGLSPGSYLVVAVPSDAGRSSALPLTDAELDERLARLQRGPGSFAPEPIAPRTTTAAAATPSAANFRYAPIYHPSAADPDQAIVITVAEGEERAGIDITLQLVRTLTVSGVVTAPPGVSLETARLIARRRSSTVESSTSMTSSATIDSAGRFSYANLLPGSYRISATTVTTTPAFGPAGGSGTMRIAGVHWAIADLSLRDADVTGLALTLRPGLKMTGRFAFDSRTNAPPPDVVSLRPRLLEVTGAPALSPWVTRPDGSFDIDGIVPGTYSVEAPAAPAPWRLRSVVVNGRDILDFPLDIGPDTTFDSAVVTYTDRRSELSGTLQSTSNTPAPEYFIVVFAADRAFWRPASRRVQFTRPGTDGRFTFNDLPPGDYRVAALTDLEPADLFEASFIDALVPASLPVTIRDGERSVQDLRLR